MNSFFRVLAMELFVILPQRTQTKEGSFWLLLSKAQGVNGRHERVLVQMKTKTSSFSLMSKFPKVTIPTSSDVEKFLAEITMTIFLRERRIESELFLSRTLERNVEDKDLALGGL